MPRQEQMAMVTVAPQRDALLSTAPTEALVLASMPLVEACGLLNLMPVEYSTLPSPVYTITELIGWLKY
jgi:hypothetical protein